jgi:hypothetical protein
LTVVADIVVPLGPDPRIPADQLAAMSTAAARNAAGNIAAAARSLAVACTTGAPAVAQLTRGWSNTAPRVGVGRLLHTAEATAVMLTGQAAAIDCACTMIEQAKSEAALDVTLAAAEIRGLRRTAAIDLLGAALGAAELADGIRLAGIGRRLCDALAGRVEQAHEAVAALRSALAANDPTTGPDALRSGRHALLPPDPLMNPAHRTDVRNRGALAADLHSGNPVRIRFAASVLEALHHAGNRTGTVQLVVYDSAAFQGQGRAAISVGDLTTATNVAVLVPGIANSPSSMGGGLDLAADLREESDRQSPGRQTAVVAWYGYDIPLSWPKDPGSSISTDVLDTVAAASAGNAASGAPLLAADLTSIKAMSQSSARMALLGFSMGSTIVSEAAQYELPVDSIVLMGSPGAGWDTTRASGYRNVPASDVYVLSYDQDPVTRPVTDELASELYGMHEPYGPDPAAGSFGGNHIDADTNVPMMTGTGLIPLILRATGDPRHHSMANYMEGRALVAEGSIVVGRNDKVPTKAGR